MPQDVFISYATPDLQAAKRVKTLLIKSGINSWIATRDSKGEWRDTIFEAIKSSRVVLLLWSKNSLASHEVKHEIDLAEKYRRAIVPIRLDTSELQGGLAYVLSGAHWIDASSGPIDRHSKALIEAVRDRLAGMQDTIIDDATANDDQSEGEDDATANDDQTKGEYAIAHVYRIDAPNSDLLHVLRDCPSLTGVRSAAKTELPQENGDLCAELIKRRLRPCFSCLKLLRSYHEGPGTLISTVTWPDATLWIETERLSYERKGFLGPKLTEIPWYDVCGVTGLPNDWLNPNRIEILAKGGEFIKLLVKQDPLWHAVGAVLAGLAGFRW